MEWSDTIRSLDSYLRIFKKVNPDKSPVEAYKDYDNSYKFKHKTISGQLYLMLHAANNLASVNRSQFNFIINTLSTYQEVAQTLCKVGVLPNSTLAVWCNLLDLERPNINLKVDIKSIFINDLLLEGFITPEEAKLNVSFGFIQTHNSNSLLLNSYDILVGNKRFRRYENMYELVEEHPESPPEATNKDVLWEGFPT